jgi:hypothetical protein
VRARLAEINPLDVGVGVSTSQKSDLHHPGYMNVVDKRCFPHESKGILGAPTVNPDVSSYASDLRNEFRYHHCLL